MEEFRAAIKSLKLDIKSDEDIKHLFQQFDTTNNGQIDLNEFLKQLRPSMSERRQKAVSNLFTSMDVNKDGQLTILDLKVYHLSLFLSLNKHLYFRRNTPVN